MVFASRSRRHQQGVALPLVLMVSSVVLLLAVGMLKVTVGDLTFTAANRSRTRAFYAAEMGLARAYDKLRTDYYGGVSNLQPNIVYAGQAADSTGSTPAQKALPDETFDAQRNFYEAVVSTADGRYRIRYQLMDAPWLVVAPDATKAYQVEAVARDLDRGTWSGLRATLTAKRTMMWYYGVFFQDDIETGTAAPMSFFGPVHTNRNMYLSPSQTLTFDSQITAAGHISRTDPTFDDGLGTVRIKDGSGNYVTMTTSNDSIVPLNGNNFNAYDIMDPSKGDGLGNPADTWKVDPQWKQSALDNWDGKVRDVSHGVTEEAPPPVQSIDRNGFYEQNAGLKIITRANGSTAIFRADGTQVDPASLGANNPISTSQFWNGRERMTVKVTNVDVGKLTAAGLYPANGLIYATREDAVADRNPNDTTLDNQRRPHGIRLQNAATLPGPMTIVSNVPTYTQGNFNVHRDANGRSPGQAGYNPATDTWKPAAIMSDAMTILSNSWSDASNTNQNNRNVAGNAEVNTVIISGFHPSNPTEGFSGGLHNYPRFLENWNPTGGQKTLTFRGSLIELWKSRFATGPWSDDPPAGFSYYKPPVRDWGIDPAFSAAAMPPAFADLFPSTTRQLEQRKWQQLQPDEALLPI
jgi:hypothetical protein